MTTVDSWDLMECWRAIARRQDPASHVPIMKERLDRLGLTRFYDPQAIFLSLT